MIRRRQQGVAVAQQQDSVMVPQLPTRGLAVVQLQRPQQGPVLTQQQQPVWDMGVARALNPVRLG